MRHTSQIRKTLRLITLAAIGVMLSGGGFSAEPEPKKAEEKYYVRPLPADPNTAELLEETGINSLKFEYRIPKDHKAVIGFIATDEKGKFIEDMSGIYHATGEEGKINQSTVRMIRIDPGAFTENYAGKDRWIWRVNGFGTSKWQPNRYTTEGMRTSWTDVKEIREPVRNKDYLIWEIKSYPKDVHSAGEDTPAKFRYQIMFKFMKLEEGESYRSTSNHFLRNEP